MDEPTAMKIEKEIREEIRRIRERARSLSGFWVAELAAAAQALEWALGKHPRAPSEDIGSTDSAQGRIAASLLKAAQVKAGSPEKPARKGESRPAPRRGPAKKRG
jgi:hypothetical protein